MALAVQAFRIALTALSFWGLCELVRERLDAETAFLPAATASGIIILLMAGGIARILPYAWGALCVGGLLGLLVSLARRRLRVNWAVGLLGLLTVYACLHFRDAYYTGNDSVSHWGLVVRHMLETNRFPDASSELVFFKSYPLGTASFIYYACCALNAREGQYLAAMLMLYPIYLLPVGGLIRRNRLIGFTVIAAIMAVIVFVLGRPTSLQVDVMLGCMTVGALATVAYYRDRPWLAMKLALPTAMALVMTKASGILFALLIALALAWASRSAGLPRRGKGGTVRLLALALVAIVAAFLLWQVHVRLTFGADNMGKHSFSLSEYASSASQKSGEQVAVIAKRMAKWLVWPNAQQRWLRAGCLAVYGLCLAGICLWRPNRSYWLSALRRTFIASVALYLLWYVLLFLMYLFSMPLAEALSLASITRYEGTMQTVTMGLLAMFAVSCFCGEDMIIGRRAYARAVSALLALVCLPVAGTAQGRALARKAILPERVTQQPFKGFLELERRGEIERDKSYLVFVKHAEHSLTQAYYLVKYEMQTLDIAVLATQIDDPWLDREYDLDGYYMLDGIRGNQEADVTQIDDLQAFFDTRLPRYDYLLLFSEDSRLEASLEDYTQTHATGIRVLRCY